MLAHANRKDGHLEIIFQSMRIGETVFVYISAEPLTELADEIKKRYSLRNTAFSGFSKGHINYLATD